MHVYFFSHKIFNFSSFIVVCVVLRCSEGRTHSSNSIQSYMALPPGRPHSLTLCTLATSTTTMGETPVCWKCYADAHTLPLNSLTHSLTPTTSFICWLSPTSEKMSKFKLTSDTSPTAVKLSTSNVSQSNFLYHTSLSQKFL